MGVYESNANIRQAYKDLNIVWDKTKTMWKDSKAKQFEKEFFEQFNIEVRRAMNALDNAGIMLDRIRSDVKDRS